ncbi:MAG TPA: hypothetical protein VGY58_15685 [Gemmataceae bacterium]|nr:hypothetical protein [Gemmataceae bacterium]
MPLAKSNTCHFTPAAIASAHLPEQANACYKEMGGSHLNREL